MSLRDYLRDPGAHFARGISIYDTLENIKARRLANELSTKRLAQDNDQMTLDTQKLDLARQQQARLAAESAEAVRQFGIKNDPNIIAALAAAEAKAKQRAKLGVYGEKAERDINLAEKAYEEYRADPFGAAHTEALRRYGETELDPYGAKLPPGTKIFNPENRYSIMMEQEQVKGQAKEKELASAADPIPHLMRAQEEKTKAEFDAYLAKQKADEEQRRITQREADEQRNWRTKYNRDDIARGRSVLLKELTVIDKEISDINRFTRNAEAGMSGIPRSRAAEAIQNANKRLETLVKRREDVIKGIEAEKSLSGSSGSSGTQSPIPDENEEIFKALGI